MLSLPRAWSPCFPTWGLGKAPEEGGQKCHRCPTSGWGLSPNDLWLLVPKFEVLDIFRVMKELPCFTASVDFIGDSRQVKMFMRAVFSGSSSWECCRFDGPEPRGDRSRS